MIDPQAITEARQALGRQLAAFRDAAGLIQGDLASLVHYGRSTIANVETGRQSCRRSFWESCDEVLRADGVLISAYEELKALERRQRRDIAREMNPERGTRMSDDGADADAQADVDHEVEIAASTSQPHPASLWAQGAPTGPRLDMVTLRLRLDGREVAVPVSRRLLLQAGIGSVVEAFAIGQPSEVLHEDIDRQGMAERITVDSPAYVDEVLGHLREQWYALVKTDNLLGPRFALAGVLNQIGIVEALLPALRDRARLDAVSLGAQYAESAAWLYEDSGNMPRARYWTGRAMEWAYEADDRRMSAWTILRRSQQVAATGDGPRAIGLAQAARRDEEHLATPTRAAIRVQEAYGHALDSDGLAAQKLIDDAHAWAASDTEGDARGGHGSYCTPSYIEIQRANCWLASGKPKKAIALYEDGLRRLPPVYQRDHAAGLARLAAAYVADGQIEQAARTAHTALPVARSSGSRRTLNDIRSIGGELASHRSLQAVAELVDDLADQVPDMKSRVRQ